MRREPADPAPAPPDSSEVASALTEAFATILSDSQRVYYERLPATERAAYREMFLRSRDPTPTTNSNEFLIELIRRTRFALEECRPPRADRWDSRGNVALRFGVPPVRSKYMGDVIPGLGIDPPSETWTYPAARMTFSFIDPSLKGEYILGRDEKRVVPLPRSVEPGDNASRSAPQRRDIESEMTRRRADEREATAQRAVLEVPLSYAYEPPAEPIPFVYDIACFRGEDGKTDVALNYQFPMSALSFAPDGDLLRARPTKRVRVSSPDYEILTEDERTFSVSCENAQGAQGDLLLTDVWRLDMPAGEYIVAASIEDPNTGRAGHGKSRISVPGFSESHFALSDILIGSAMSEAAKFERTGTGVVPHPVRAFRSGSSLVVYFEAYGLTEVRPGVSRLEVETEVTVRDPSRKSSLWERLFGGRRGSTSSRVTLEGTAPMYAHYFSLSTANLIPGTCELKIRVVDLSSGATAERVEKFTVLER